MFPGLDLFFVPDPGDVWNAACLGGNEACFGDEKGAWDGTALRIVVGGEWEMDVIVIGTNTREWR